MERSGVGWGGKELVNLDREDGLGLLGEDDASIEEGRHNVVCQNHHPLLYPHLASVLKHYCSDLLIHLN